MASIMAFFLFCTRSIYLLFRRKSKIKIKEIVDYFGSYQAIFLRRIIQWLKSEDSLPKSNLDYFGSWSYNFHQNFVIFTFKLIKIEIFTFLKLGEMKIWHFLLCKIHINWDFDSWTWPTLRFWQFLKGLSR